MTHLMLSAIILPIALVATSCSMAHTTSSEWQSVLLANESALAAAQKTVWIRDDFMPRLSEPDALTTDLGRLPPDSGAVVGICFSQQPGTSTPTPLVDEQITIRSKRAGIFVTRSDENGLFVETFTPGDYEVSCRGRVDTISIRKGKTSPIKLDAK